MARFLNHACGPSKAANVTPIYAYTFDSEDVLHAQLCENLSASSFHTASRSHPTVQEPVDARLPHVALFTNRAVTKGEALTHDMSVDLRALESCSLGTEHELNDLRLCVCMCVLLRTLYFHALDKLIMMYVCIHTYLHTQHTYICMCKLCIDIHTRVLVKRMK